MILAAGVVISSLVGTGTARAATPEDNQRTYATQIADLFELINQARSKAGVTPAVFLPAPSLTHVQSYSDSLAATDADSVWRDLDGLRFSGTEFTGETVLFDVASKLTPKSAIDTMLADPDPLILMPAWDQFGIGWSRSPGGKNYVVITAWNGSVPAGTKTCGTRACAFDALGGVAPQPTPTPTPTPTTPTPTTPAPGAVNVYTTPGFHTVNGRRWHTTCDKYSTTIRRCRAEIWATQITYSNGRYVQANGWAFNNLTYLPVPRAQWKGNPFAKTGEFTSSGRQWKTSCGDAWTGPNGCRSFVKTDVHTSYLDGSGQRRYKTLRDQWVFNNVITFSD